MATAQISFGGPLTRIIHRPFGGGNAVDRQVGHPLDCAYRSHIAVRCAHLPLPRVILPAPGVSGLENPGTVYGDGEVAHGNPTARLTFKNCSRCGQLPD